jgi:hypothetical protein
MMITGSLAGFIHKIDRITKRKSDMVCSFQRCPGAKDPGRSSMLSHIARRLRESLRLHNCCVRPLYFLVVNFSRLFMALASFDSFDVQSP